MTSDIFNEKIKEQIVEALNECDGIIFMVDGKDGLNPNDSHLAKMVRHSSKNYVLAVNKCDTPDHSDRINPFFSLGLKDPVPISGLNGAGVGDILDTLFVDVMYHCSMFVTHHFFPSYFYLYIFVSIYIKIFNVNSFCKIKI